MEMQYQLAFSHARLAFPGVFSKLNPSATCAPAPWSFALQLSEVTDTEPWSPSGMSDGYPSNMLRACPFWATQVLWVRPGVSGVS